MVTLTYPGDRESVAPNGASVKRHMVLWRKRFQREWGEPRDTSGSWSSGAAGAPHIHLWMAPRHAVGRLGRPLREWLSHVWAKIAAHPDPEQRARHELAGTAVDIRNGLRTCDPKRLAIYFTKHSSPNQLGDKESSTSSPTPGGGRAGAQAGSGACTDAAGHRDCSCRSRRVPLNSADRAPLVKVQGWLGRLHPSLPTAVVAGLAASYLLVNDGPALASQLAASAAGTSSGVTGVVSRWCRPRH